MSLSSNEITFSILLFGALKDAVGDSSVSVTLTSHSTMLPISELLQRLTQQCPALERYLPFTRVAVNFEYVDFNHVLHEGDEVALIPPVAGGHD